MQQSCHRCDASLSREDTFCPACGAPQLNFDASSQDAVDPHAGQQAEPGRPGQVMWRDAIGAATIIAVPTGIACGLLSMASFLWVVAGASLAIMLYKKKRPMALLSGRAGIRIGCLTGLFITYVSVAVDAVFSVVQRYSLHQGATIDRFYESNAATSGVLLANMFQSADMQAQIRATTRFWLTQDGRAASSLVAIASAALTTLLFASLGGYLGVRLFAGRRPV